MTPDGSAPFTTDVGQDGRASHRTIASALSAVSSGARILIHAGTYSERLCIETDVELVADGEPGSVRIVAPANCLEVIGGSVVVRGVAFWQGQPKQGGISRMLGRATTQEPVVPSLIQPSGTAIQVTAGTLTLEDCSISAATGFAIATGQPGTRIEIRHSRIHRVSAGIAVLGGATGLIEDCDFSEWTHDAVWASRLSSRVEVRDCRFATSTGQAIYVDKGATALVERCAFEDVGAAMFIGDEDTQALVRTNVARRCEKAGLMVVGGAHVVAEDNTCSSAKIGIVGNGRGTSIKVSGGLLEENDTGLGVMTEAHVTATDVEIVGGRDCASVSGGGSHLDLRGCSIRDAAEVGAIAKDGAALIIDGGAIASSSIGVRGLDAGCQVAVRHAKVHDHSGPGISIGKGSMGTIEGSEVFDNAFPGIVTVGGRLRAFHNKVHGNRSNGIAIRDGADAVVEGNEIWANALPAITVVGAGSQGMIRENTVRDNAGQGIYVYQGASGQVVENRLMRNGLAAITISDTGASGTVERNVIEASGGPGLWVSDGAVATLTGNTVEGASEAGIFVNGGARVEARDNVVHDATVGVVIHEAAGSFAANRLTGNTAGSWCLIDAGTVTRVDNDETLLGLPDWAAPFLDLGRYVLFALRVGVELDIPPAQVEQLGSTLSLAAVAERLRDAEIGDYGDVVKAHLSTQKLGQVDARTLADARSSEIESERAGLWGSLADEAVDDANGAATS